MDLWLIILSILILIFIIYVHQKMVFFENTGVPYERPWPILGNMAAVVFRKRHFTYHVTRFYNRWPEAKYIGFFEFVKPVIIVRDIELIKTITVKHFDSFHDHLSFVNPETEPLIGKSLFNLKSDHWREIRNLLSPAFTSSKMRQMSELMISCAVDFADIIVKNAKQGNNDIDVRDAFNKYTVDVIATCAFGISLNTMKDPNNDFYQMGKKATSFSGLRTLVMFLIRVAPKLTDFLGIKLFDKKINDFFVNVIRSTIQVRKEQNIHRPDIIQLMIESKEKRDVDLDLMQMTAQAFIFFVGGFDSSSVLMSFVAVALAVHPELQDKLIDEVDEVMKKNNGHPNYDDINSMAYLEAFLYETLRYYPMVGFLDRICTESFELPPALPGHKPFVVKAGTNVWIASHGIHFDPKYYDNPNDFNPDRFLNQKINVNMPTYLTFGIGPRACIGNRFALLENKLVLFFMLTKCKFAKSSKLKVPIRMSKKSFLPNIEGGFWLKILPRD